MTSPPFRDRGKSLTLAPHVAQVHIREPHHPHRGRLDDRDRAAARVEHNHAQPRRRAGRLAGPVLAGTGLLLMFTLWLSGAGPCSAWYCAVGRR